MSQITIRCPECLAELALAARRLLVRVDDGTATSGEVLFPCLSCSRTAALDLDQAGIAALVLAGVTHVRLSQPVVEHPELAPEGPALTTDDLLDLHRALVGDTWFDELAQA